MDTDEAETYEIDLTADEELLILLDETFEDTGVLLLKTAQKTIQRLTAQLADAEAKVKRLTQSLVADITRTASVIERVKKESVAAGLEMAAKVADDLCMDASGFTEEEHAYGVVAKAISTLADQHKPSPAEEPMP